MKTWNADGAGGQIFHEDGTTLMVLTPKPGETLEATTRRLCANLIEADVLHDSLRGKAR